MDTSPEEIVSTDSLGRRRQHTPEEKRRIVEETHLNRTKTESRRWISMGLIQSGRPRHPLRQKGGERLNVEIHARAVQGAQIARAIFDEYDGPWVTT